MSRVAFAILLCLGLLTYGCAQTPVNPSRAALAAFIESHRKADGAYGAPGQIASEERWTWWAVQSHGFQALDVPHPDRLAAALRAFSPGGPELEAKALAREETRRVLGLSPLANPDLPPLGAVLPPPANWLGSLPLAGLETGARLRGMLTGRPSDAEVAAAYLAWWRGKDGGYGYPIPLDAAFDEVRAAGIPADSTLCATAAAVGTLMALGLPVPEPEAVVSFVKGRQRRDGSWRNGPTEEGPGDLTATWGALRTLVMLGVIPPRIPETYDWIAARRHASGGFAFHPDEPASLEATQLALACLMVLGAPLPPVSTEATLPEPQDPGDLKLFRIAAAQGFDLHSAPVREEHRRAWGIPGIGFATHCSDVTWETEQPVGDRDCYTSFEGISGAWQPDQARGALVGSCSYQHPPLLTPAYDRSARGGGYDLLMATWAFAEDGDLLRDRPWLQRYVGRIPVFGNHDAHGDPYHWLHRGLRARTLFFAATPDLAGFREAVRGGRVVAVAHGPGRTAFYGHPYWVARAKSERKHWDLGRVEGEEVWLPEPVVVVIDDVSATELPHFEAGRAVLVRAAARLGDDALPSEVELRIDGKRVPLQVVPPDMRSSPGLWAPLPSLAAGRHAVEVFWDPTGEERDGRPLFARSRRQELAWGAPVDAESERHPMPIPPAPSELGFDGLKDVLFARTAIGTEEFQGSLGIASSRADFFLTPAGGVPQDLVLESRGGFPDVGIRIWINGTPLDPVELPAPEIRTLRLAVPPDALILGTNRITLRTDLPAWVPSFTVPKSAFSLERIAFEPRGEPR